MRKHKRAVELKDVNRQYMKIMFKELIDEDSRKRKAKQKLMNMRSKVTARYDDRSQQAMSSTTVKKEHGNFEIDEDKLNGWDNFDLDDAPFKKSTPFVKKEEPMQKKKSKKQSDLDGLNAAFSLPGASSPKKKKKKKRKRKKRRMEGGIPGIALDRGRKGQGRYLPPRTSHFRLKGRRRRSRSYDRRESSSRSSSRSFSPRRRRDSRSYSPRSRSVDRSVSPSYNSLSPPRKRRKVRSRRKSYTRSRSSSRSRSRSLSRDNDRWRPGSVSP